MENINMKIALIQTSLIWENPKENRNLFHDKINTVPANTDLIILPEMFTSGFTMNPQNVAEPCKEKLFLG
jgi:predicted amidohydrolase